MPLLLDNSSSGSGGRIAASALTSGVSANTAGWGSTQDISATATGLTFTIPVPISEDISPTLKTLALRNVGTNAVTLALSGGTLNSSIGTVINPGSIWTIEAQTLTTANVTATNASQLSVGDSGTAALTVNTSLLAANNSVSTALAMPGLSFVAKETASYQVSISMHSNQTSITASFVALLVDTAAPTVAIANSETIASIISATGQFGAAKTFTMDAIAGRTYEVRVFSADGNSCAAISNSNGRSTLSWLKTSGSVPVTGQSAEYAYARLSSNASIANVAQDLVFNANTQGNIPNASGVFTLTVGKTYTVSGNFYGLSFDQATTIANIRFVDSTNTQVVGTPNTVLRPMSDTSLNGNMTAMSFPFTPGVTGTYKFRVDPLGVGRSCQIGQAESSVSIIQIGSTPIISTSEQIETSGGSAITFTPGAKRLIVNPSTLIAALTITLDSTASGNTGLVSIHFGGTIAANSPVVTALTIAPAAGQTILQALTPIEAYSGDVLTYEYSPVLSQWRRVD